jgi:stage II sporulation protein D
MRTSWWILPALTCALCADVPIRVGLDTQALEWVISLEDGGQLCRRDGRPLLSLRPGERLRIWWDSRGEADPLDEYRIQVGPPLELGVAEAVMARLRELGEAPERLRVADGDTWRILTGRYPQATLAEPILEKLAASGFTELWVSTERRPGRPRKGRALYAVTERYERSSLPAEGVLLKPKGELSSLVGKGRYRGRVEILPNAQGRLTVVNTLDLETYLRGVVPREMGPGEFPALEALKAQAVAARTYAYANRGKRAGEGFDLLDTVADQVYGGRDGEQALTDRAIRETEGLISTYGGAPIQALFMANSGGATVDNSHVFGGGQGYLKGVSNYAATPQVLPFRGMAAPRGGQDWLGWDLLRLASQDLIPAEWLDGELLGRSLRAGDLREPLAGIAHRLALEVPAASQEEGSAVLLWMARALHLDRLQAGMDRPQDADYFLGAAPVPGPDRLLAAFLTRRGIVPAAWWQGPPLSRLQGLQALARMWQELESLDISEGTLLRDGQVRPRGKDPLTLALAGPLLLAEEAPGGALRLVESAQAQVGDRMRWIGREGGSRVLVRRLDPDGASWDRYNPTAHWRVEVREAELAARLRERVGIQSIRGLEVTYNDEGRALELRIRDGAGRGRSFTGMRIRGILGLKDNVFRFIEVGTLPNRRWIFYGRGWGHGVGMDQTGAYGMALEGASCEQILAHYYQGIELRPIR